MKALSGTSCRTLCLVYITEAPITYSTPILHIVMTELVKCWTHVQEIRNLNPGRVKPMTFKLILVTS